MKKGRTLQELAAELDRQQKAKRDFKTPTTDLEMVVGEYTPAHKAAQMKPDVELKINGYGAFGINRVCHEQIGGRLGIPRAYYDRMRQNDPELLAMNVNRWFQREPEQRLVRTLDHTGRAFLSNKYRPIDNYPIAGVSLETLTKLHAEVRSCEVTESRMYIKAVVMEITAKVRNVGDVVAAGMLITNSEVGKGTLKVEPFIEVLRCTNGMVVNEASLRKYHIGRSHGEADQAEELITDATREADDKVLLMKVRDIVRGSLKQDVFERVVERMSMATERRINGDIVKAVEVTQEMFGLNDVEKSDVLQTLIKGGKLSQYGLVDAVTEASQRVSDYDRATELERLGGVLLELPERQWNQIAEAKAA